MLRRFIIIAICLSLAGMAQLPVTACALLAGLPGECSQPASEQHCNQMDRMSPPDEVKVASDPSCCRVIQAPLPEAQSKADAPEAGAEAVPSASFLVLPPQPIGTADSVGSRILSPPNLQPLLCVFLI